MSNERALTTPPRLWRLSPVDVNDRRWGWDCYWGFIVRAETEGAARALAAAKAADEGKDSWLSPTFSKCEELTADGAAPEIILGDFHAG